jgi:hypothetical protein
MASELRKDADFGVEGRVSPVETSHYLPKSDQDAAVQHVPTPDSVEAATPGRRQNRARSLLGYVKTKQFWIVLLFGQILALCITGTNTFSSLLAYDNVSIPAFQTFFNYVLLNVVWTPITIYKVGFKGWRDMFVQHGWKCKFRIQIHHVYLC